MNGQDAELRRRLDELQRQLQGMDKLLAIREGAFAGLLERLARLEAQLQAVDESFVRHQQQNEDDSRRAEQTVDRVGQDLSNHLGDHWRERR